MVDTAISLTGHFRSKEEINFQDPWFKKLIELL
jgi:hypothetical protein